MRSLILALLVALAAFGCAKTNPKATKNEGNEGMAAASRVAPPAPSDSRQGPSEPEPTRPTEEASSSGTGKASKPNWLTDPRYAKTQPKTESTPAAPREDENSIPGKPGWGLRPPEGGWTPPAGGGLQPLTPSIGGAGEALPQQPFPPAPAGGGLQPLTPSIGGAGGGFPQQPFPPAPAGGGLQPLTPSISTGAAPQLPGAGGNRPVPDQPESPPKPKTGGKTPVTEKDMREVWTFIDTASGASGMMPGPEVIYASLVKANSPAAALIKNGAISLTATQKRESVWAFETEALSRGGLVVSQNGVETLTATELIKRLMNP